MANVPEVDHELGTHGDQDIIKGPAASEDAVFVRVTTTEDIFEADLLTDALADEGITAAAFAQKDHPVDPLVRPALPWWVIEVPREDAARALAIVEARRAELKAVEPMAEVAAEEEERLGEMGGPLPE